MVENVVGNIGQKFQFDGMFIQFDALRGGRVSRVTMKIDVAEPKQGWYIINDELQSALGSLANTLVEEILDKVASFDLLTIFAFPMREGSELGLDVALTENMVKDVFQIQELFT